MFRTRHGSGFYRRADLSRHRREPSSRVRSQAERDEVHKLIQAGMNDCAIMRATGIPRPTVRDWRHQGPMRYLRRSVCPRCDGVRLDHSAYAYLLGLYLGDGCLTAHGRHVFRLRISLDARYPNIVAECARAMAIVSGRGVGYHRPRGCIVVNAYWKH